MPEQKTLRIFCLGILLSLRFRFIYFTSLGLFIDLCRDNFDSTTSCLDLCPCASRKFMSMYRQGMIYLAPAEHLNQATALSGRHKSLLCQIFRSNLARYIEKLKVNNINNSIFVAESCITVAQTAEKRQTL